MKKLFIIASMLVSMYAAAQNDTTYVRNGDTFVAIKSSASSGNTQTQFKYEVGGNSYPIWISKNGRCFIVRMSAKTGNEYKQYLGEEISRQVCKELGVTYVEK